MLKHRQAWCLALVVMLLAAGVVLFGYDRLRGTATKAALMVGKDPDVMALDPTTHNVFVLNYGDGTVSMIDSHHPSTVRTIDVGHAVDPVGYDVAVSSATGRVFVADGGHVVQVLDAASGSPLGTTSLSTLVPGFLAVDERTARVFVSETSAANVATGHTVSVLDAHTGAWLRRVSAGAGTGPLAVDERSGHVFVQDLAASTVVMLDVRTGALLRTIALGGPSILSQAHTLGGPLPALIAVDSTAGRVFVARYGAVAMLDARTGTLLHTTRVGRIPTALAADARTNRVFVANMLEGTVSVLDSRTGARLHTVRVGHRPWALAVAVSAGRVCVANVDDDTVSVLDARSGRVLRTMPTGVGPTAIAVDERLARVYVVNKLVHRPAPPAAHRGEWARFLQFIPFIPHVSNEGSNAIPGSVSIISVAR